MKPVKIVENEATVPEDLWDWLIDNGHGLETQCGLCQISGYSDSCQLVQTDKCAYHEAQQESKRLLGQREGTRVAVSA